ncbi:hypothetical protein Q3G72_032689 [Acer saccharum]|nr:hypothetical protein Q3G72_032689 [Acer saccharum]
MGTKKKRKRKINLLRFIFGLEVMAALLKYLQGGGDTGLLSVKVVRHRFCSFLGKPEQYENLSSHEIRDISEFHQLVFESILHVITGKNKEDRNKILKDHGYDKKHQMIITNNSPKLKSREKIIDKYIKILSTVV